LTGNANIFWRYLTQQKKAGVVKEIYDIVNSDFEKQTPTSDDTPLEECITVFKKMRSCYQFSGYIELRAV
jgi:hypothetical protein